MAAAFVLLAGATSCRISAAEPADVRLPAWRSDRGGAASAIIVRPVGLYARRYGLYSYRRGWYSQSYRDRYSYYRPWYTYSPSRLLTLRNYSPYMPPIAALPWPYNEIPPPLYFEDFPLPLEAFEEPPPVEAFEEIGPPRAGGGRYYW